MASPLTESQTRGLPLKQPKIQSLDIWNKTIIVTTCKVQQGDIYSYLKKKVRGREFAKDSIFKIYAGAHGYSDGHLGDRKSGQKQLQLDIEYQIKDGLEEARDVHMMKNEKVDDLHEQLGKTNTERIMENIASKSLIWHIRRAVSDVRKEEKKVIQEMNYRLLNPDEIGKEDKDEELECYHEDMILDVFENMIHSPKPYVIFLAFCTSDINELTQYMRELGVISACSMKNDIGEITKGRWFVLNEDQAEVVKQVQDYNRDGGVEKGKHLLLCGGPGTGKTILLAETFKMRIDHCKRMMKKGEKPLRIIIVVWCMEETDPVFQRTKNEYFAHLKEGIDKHGNKVEFHTFESLKWGFPASLEDSVLEVSTPGVLSNIAREFSCPDVWSKTLIYIDEFRMEINSNDKIQNFNSEFDEVGNDVDTFVAVTPWVGCDEYLKYNVTKPQHSTVLAKQLHQKHRNGLKIDHLLRHITRKRSHGILDDAHDTIAKMLPESEVTVWISVDSALPFPLVLSLIDDKYIRSGQKVTVVTESGIFMKVTKQWCDNDVRKKFVRAHDGYNYNVAGYEDDVVIYIDCPPTLPQEQLSRARERLIIVTPSAGKDNLNWKWGYLFNVSGLLDHETGECPLGDLCPSKHSLLLEVLDLKLQSMNKRFTAMDVNAKDESGMTKLHLLSLLGEHEKVKDLVQNPTVNVDEEVYGMTPLHLAVHGCHVNVVETLLGDIRVDSGKKDDWGMVALDLAREREEYHQGLANESEMWLGLYMRSYENDFKESNRDKYDYEKTKKLVDDYKSQFEGHNNMVLRCEDIQKKLYKGDQIERT